MTQKTIRPALEKWDTFLLNIAQLNKSDSAALKPSKTVSVRIDYIDFLRAIAVMIMIFAHVLDAVLAPEYKQDNFYRFLNFVNGFIAPAFLFAAGASFTLVIFKKRDDILNLKAPAFRQLWRIIQIFLIGYLLHIPFKTLHQMQTIMTDKQYLFFIRTDVLHVIAIGLFLSFVIFLLPRNEKKYLVIILILALVFIAVTPFSRYFDFAAIFPLEIATYFNKNYYSIFPLFPWLAFLFLGSIVMFFIEKARREGNHDETLKKILLMSIVLILMASIPEFIGLKPNESYNFWHTSANIVCIKIGVVLSFMVFLWYMQKRFGYKMKYLKIFGQESLFVYVCHLVIVYGSVLSSGLARELGRNHTRIEMFLIYFGVLVLSYLATLFWHKIKIFSLLFTRIILFSISIYFFYYFVTKLY